MGNAIEKSIQALSTELEMEDIELTALYTIFLDETQELIEDFNKYTEMKAYDALKKAVHTLKGVTANVKLGEIYDIAQVIENKLKSNETAEIAENIGHLVHTIIQYQKGIRDYYLNKGFEL